MSNLSGSPGPIPEHSLPFNSLQSPPPTSKRKRDDDEEIGVEMKLLKPAKRKRAKIPKPIDEDLDLDQGLNFAIGKLDRHLLADYVAQRHKRFSPGLSIVELEDKHIPGM